MSISETFKVDIVAVKPGGSEVRLVITDHLDWSDFHGHASLIQQKVNSYIAYVESGQLRNLQSPKLPQAPKICVVLALQYPATDEAVDFLSKVGIFLNGIGIGWLVEIRNGKARQ